MHLRRKESLLTNSRRRQSPSAMYSLVMRHRRVEGVQPSKPLFLARHFVELIGWDRRTSGQVVEISALQPSKLANKLLRSGGEDFRALTQHCFSVTLDYSGR